MMTDRVRQIECPGCGVAIPMRASTRPDGKGMSTTFDESFLDEHMEMHANCDCVWMDGQRHHSPACKVHN
jgi:hypothetical protein